jgi:adenosylcobinamide-GDP ribazoletransferase
MAEAFGAETGAGAGAGAEPLETQPPSDPEGWLSQPQSQSGPYSEQPLSQQPQQRSPLQPQTEAARQVLSGLRLSFSTLTIARVGVGSGQLHPRAPGIAMTFAPLVGGALGGVAATAGWALRWWSQSDLMGAIAAIAVLAILTRALHLDGLADTVDALGSNKPAAQALEVMKRSDIGPFGVVALVLVVLFQIGGAAVAFAHHREFVALITAAAVGRLAVTAACTAPVPSARRDGLGAWVAGSVSVRTAVLVGGVTAVACGAIGLATDHQTAALAVAAVAVGMAAALLLLQRCLIRLGGITGDVLGALVETATTAALVILAFR